MTSVEVTQSQGTVMTEPRSPVREPEVLFYDAPFQLYGLGFSNSSSHPSRAAVTSFIPTSSSNKIQIIDRRPYDQDYEDEADDDQTNYGYNSSNNNNNKKPQAKPDYNLLAQASHPFPPTRVTWEPRPFTNSSSSSSRLTSTGTGERQTELLATTGDALRVWEVETSMDGWAEPNDVGDGGSEDDEDGDRFGYRRDRDRARVGYGGRPGEKVRLRERSKLTNGKVPANQVPPLTSFSWSDHSPNLLVTSSIDTTCTLWDIHTSTALTQLIAHDRAVHDVSFLPHSSDVFVSVGSDGSLRAFDLRALEHSTILYEDPGNKPLMRVEFGKKEQHYLGVFGMGEEAVQVLDMRSPGVPVVELRGHKKGRDGAVNAIAWGCEGRASPGGAGWLASCGDDAQVLLYDCTQPLPYPQSSSNPSSAASSPANFTPPPPAAGQGKSGTAPGKSSSSTHLCPTKSGASTPGAGQSRAASRGGTSSSTQPAVVPKRYPVRAWNNQLDGFLSSSQVGSAELNNLAWGCEGQNGQGVWLGVVGGRRLSCLRF